MFAHHQKSKKRRGQLETVFSIGILFHASADSIFRGMIL
ncbi:hypothetical protein D3OALGB2SA_3153 [Olavius algarvensis associated proteobacterium Delta 3]|nr:hypothetical protein D3OALGB2SA_3153 [Olavius algarvensis associated proteobacterium Delta 3]